MLTSLECDKSYRLAAIKIVAFAVVALSKVGGSPTPLDLGLSYLSVAILVVFRPSPLPPNASLFGWRSF